MTTLPTFRTAFCTQVGCSDSAFERALFWRGLYRHAMPLAFLLRFMARGFFRDDDEFIRWVGGAASLAEVEEEIERFQYGNRVRAHWLRTGLRIQLDPRRIWAAAHCCLVA